MSIARILMNIRHFMARASDRSLGNRGVVAMLVGLSAPALVMALALGIELASWTVTKQKLQRTADAAAIAAALTNARGSSLQAAATEAAYVAEINGALGATSRTWFDATNTFSDNMITIQKTAGIVNSNDTAFIATIRTTVPLLFASYVLPARFQTLAATATAENVQSGSQPCLLTLGGDLTGVTTGTDVDFRQR
jgi:uncharacterized membrane protein